MDIITFSESLLKQLKENNPSMPNDMLKTGKALSNIRSLLITLKGFTVRYSFANPQEEIKFFKEINPVALSQLYYHKELFKIQVFDSFRDHKSRIDNYHKMLRKLQRYVFNNRDFYEYCLSGNTYLDHQYFTRNNAHLKIYEDSNFSTRYDRKLGKLLAYEMIKDFIINKINDIENQQLDKISANLQWTDSKVALIELIYALQASGSINHNKVDTKQIVNAFENLFAINLGNYARVFMEIRIRKSGQTNFLDHLKERLTNHILELDNL